MKPLNNVQRIIDNRRTRRVTARRGRGKNGGRAMPAPTRERLQNRNRLCAKSAQNASLSRRDDVGIVPYAEIPYIKSSGKKNCPANYPTNRIIRQSTVKLSNKSNRPANYPANRTVRQIIRQTKSFDKSSGISNSLAKRIRVWMFYSLYFFTFSVPSALFAFSVRFSHSQVKENFNV